MLSQEVQGEVRPNTHNPAFRGYSKHQGALVFIRKQEDTFQGRRQNVMMGLSLRSWGLSAGTFPPLQAPSTVTPESFPVSEPGTWFHGVRLVCLSPSVLGQASQKCFLRGHLRSLPSAPAVSFFSINSSVNFLSASTLRWISKSSQAETLPSSIRFCVFHLNSERCLKLAIDVIDHWSHFFPRGHLKMSGHQWGCILRGYCRWLVMHLVDR